MLGTDFCAKQRLDWQERVHSTTWDSKVKIHGDAEGVRIRNAWNSPVRKFDPPENREFDHRNSPEQNLILTDCEIDRVSQFDGQQKFKSSVNVHSFCDLDSPGIENPSLVFQSQTGLMIERDPSLSFKCCYDLKSCNYLELNFFLNIFIFCDKRGWSNLVIFWDL